jgi:hypothetical protein
MHEKMYQPITSREHGSNQSERRRVLDDISAKCKNREKKEKDRGTGVRRVVCILCRGDVY